MNSQKYPVSSTRYRELGKLWVFAVSGSVRRCTKQSLDGVRCVGACCYATAHQGNLLAGVVHPHEEQHVSTVLIQLYHRIRGEGTNETGGKIGGKNDGSMKYGAFSPTTRIMLISMDVQLLVFSCPAMINSLVWHRLFAKFLFQT